MTAGTRNGPFLASLFVSGLCAGSFVFGQTLDEANSLYGEGRIADSIADRHVRAELPGSEPPGIFTPRRRVADRGDRFARVQSSRDHRDDPGKKLGRVDDLRIAMGQSCLLACGSYEIFDLKLGHRRQQADDS